MALSSETDKRHREAKERVIRWGEETDGLVLLLGTRMFERMFTTLGQSKHRNESEQGTHVPEEAPEELVEGDIHHQSAETG